MKIVSILCLFLFIGCSPESVNYHYKNEYKIKSGFYKNCVIRAEISRFWCLEGTIVKCSNKSAFEPRVCIEYNFLDKENSNE